MKSEQIVLGLDSTERAVISSLLENDNIRLKIAMENEEESRKRYPEQTDYDAVEDLRQRIEYRIRLINKINK